MAKSEKKDYTRLREIAKEFFMKGMSCRDIAEMIGVTEVTLSKWRNDGESSWDEEKKALSLTPARIKQLLLVEAEKIANGEQASLAAKQLGEIMKVIAALDKKVNPQVIVDVFMEFDNWMTTVDPKQAAEFTKMHKQFIAYRISLES